MKPSIPSQLSAADAWHLLTRTGFMPSPSELAPWVGLSSEAAVDRLLAAAQRAQPLHPAPAFTREAIQTPYGRLANDDARKDARQQARTDTIALAAWWLQEMRETPTPLAERMTLFWHNHFATSMQKVQQPQGMYFQHQLFRQHALGSFRELLHAVARDPAMLIYLDGAANRAQAPNENFAREVMELFSLGEGQYGETDIKEAARAFSGWAVDRESWRAQLRPRLHDDGEKTLFGRTARFDADSALDVMLEQPAAARFITTKLWREFVSPTPNAASVERIANQLRSSGWRIDAALRELLLSEQFWAAESRAALIKSPIELAVGTLRQFDIQLDSALPLVAVTSRLGQSLFYPPNVKGWSGYTDWINSTSLLNRKRFTERLFRALEVGSDGAMDASAAPMVREMIQEARARERRALRQARMEAAGGQSFGMRFDAEGWLKPLGAWPDREPDAAAQAQIVAAVLAAPPVNPMPAGTVGLSYLRALSLDPTFQLK
ncbi:MAG: DUF1800 domain-containing protein [Cytophagales bacterium]|nr:DUF1800 domain-containing protein [Rhizobacter sp.]